MGKKGKKGKKSNRGKKSSTDDLNIIGDADPEIPIPQHGWIFEKDEAAQAVKCERNQRNMFRLARAYHKLRQWDKLKNLLISSTAIGKTIPIDGKPSSKFYRKQLKVWHKEAEDNLSSRTALGCTEQKLRDIGNIDKSVFEHVTFNNHNSVHVTFNNLNPIHFAAVTGDIRLLEKIVAYGAALDFPILKFRANDMLKKEGRTDVIPYGEEAPRGSTALLLACSYLALVAVMPQEMLRIVHQDDDCLAEKLRGNLACAIQLVKLGANCNMVFKLDEDTCGQNIFKMMNAFKINNVNAYQLAAMSKNVELIQAMKDFKSKEDKIRLVHCRCGSRLPWTQCHQNPIFGTISPYYIEHKVLENPIWRLSPLANCPCNTRFSANKYKQYFKCCWQEESQYQYQHDKTGGVCGKTRLFDVDFDASGNPIPVVPSGEHSLAKILQLLEEELENPNGVRIEGQRERVFSQIRSQPSLREFVCGLDPDGNSSMYDWDVNVYVGIMESMECWFHWSDVHWHLPKSELLRRTKKWNKTLIQYCDDQNLAGTKREAVIRKHTASPLAPCANPACNEIEVAVKSFGKCSRCNRVAYCSRECQVENWKLSHKKKCGS